MCGHRRCANRVAQLVTKDAQKQIAGVIDCFGVVGDRFAEVQLIRSEWGILAPQLS